MNLLKKSLILLMFFSLISVATVVSAQGGSNNPGSGAGGSNNPPAENGSSTPSVTPVKLVNPLGDTKSLPEMIEGLLRVVLTIGIPVVALAIIYAGFQFVAAQGNPQKLQEARRTLLYVIIGATILLAAYVIAEAIVGTINAIRGN